MFVSLYVFLSHLLLLCVTDHLFSPTVTSTTRESVRNICKTIPYLPSLSCLYSHTHTHTPSTRRNAGSSLQPYLIKENYSIDAWSEYLYSSSFIATFAHLTCLELAVFV